MLSDGRLERLAPSAFALVMATGIVAIASHLAGFQRPALALFAITIVAFGLLAALHGLRLARHREAVRADLRDPVRAPGFFTWTAASAVLGSEALLLGGGRIAGWLLWSLALLLWACFARALFARLVLNREARPLEEAVSGISLLAVVATESIAVLSALLAPGLAQPARMELHALALTAWLAGIALYGWLIALLVRRLLFRPLAPEDVTPPYWIAMGAMAISTLAGALLAGNATDAPLLRAVLPFIAGITLSCWVLATAWIPALLVLGAWRHGVRRVPLRYEAAHWSVVFPLGMYSAATQVMARTLRLPSLEPVAGVFLVLAAIAWAAALAGLLASGWRRDGARAG